MDETSQIQPKRTRVNVVQSKDGCFTCKARKVKCDELHPSCLRCIRSGKICQGYLSDWRKLQVMLQRRVKTAVESPISHPYSQFFGSSYTLARIGCRAVGATSFGEEIWSRQLPQLCESSTSLMLAAAALGGAILASNIREYDREIAAGKQYYLAIQELSKDLKTLPSGPVPLMIGTILLAGVEVVQNRATNALIHILGAYKLLEMCKSKHLGFSVEKITHDLIQLCYRLDIQVSSFALDRMPDLPTGGGTNVNLRIDERIHQDIHSGYQFCHSVSDLKYKATGAPPEMLVELGRHISCLTEWTQALERSLCTTVALEVKLQYKTLRCQCLALLIYLSSIVQPNETSYDAQALNFQQIIRDAGDLLQCPNIIRFTLEPGIIQPLYLTAIKYRDQFWRRKAIRLLQDTGREGPWNGKIVTILATRAMEIEEEGENAQIAEHQRLHGIGIELQQIDVLTLSIRATFSRCIDLKKMLRDEQNKSQEHWHIWQEHLGSIP